MNTLTKVTSRKNFLKFSAAIAGVGLMSKGFGFSGKLTAENHEPVAPDGVKKKRLGMVIDMRKCEEGCTDCLTACKTAHNIPDFGDDKQHEIKWIWKEKYEHLFPDQVSPYMTEEAKDKPMLNMCYHCDDPPCVRVCPTQATFKREEDGLVVMDYHRCIGCRFCMAGCPYGARSFNFLDPRTKLENLNPEFPSRTKGVVEYCNFCTERLDKGQGPACVEACKNSVLTFGDLNDENSEVRHVLNNNVTMRRKPEIGTKPNVFWIV